MKQFIFIIFISFVCVNTTNAQVTISCSDLNGTKWQTPEQYDEEAKGFYEYTLKVMRRHLENGNTYDHPYYLSDTQTTEFDYSKTGQNTKGCYYVEMMPSINQVFCYSIIYFNKTDGKMILRPIDSPYKEIYIMIPSKKPRNQSAGIPVLENW